ncbi:MAG: glycosyltransferase [Bacteroidales bacterium]|nr:glycosyltransferase [Bacteroidales bacterium]
MTRISIIIPVWNARKGIVRCIDSVIAQSTDDLEAVLVDDHGSDDSVALARARVEDYHGPKVFRFVETPVNGGPGAARNYGIGQAAGDYVCFLDSDDTLDPDFCGLLLGAADAADADIAFGHISFDHPDGRSVARYNPPVDAGEFKGAAKRRYLLRFTSYFTTYIYRRKMLSDNNIVFPGTRSAEDSCFLICSLLCSGRIASAPRACYHYHLDDASISRRRDPARWRQRLASFRALRRFASARGIYRDYRGTLRLLIFKKGWLLAAKDFLTNSIIK